MQFVSPENRILILEGFNVQIVDAVLRALSFSCVFFAEVYKLNAQ
jgi:hypothetical protein